MRANRGDDYHKNDNQPVERVFNQFPIQHDIPRLRLLRTGTERLFPDRCNGPDNQETKKRHQHDGNPVRNVPRENRFTHFRVTPDYKKPPWILPMTGRNQLLAIKIIGQLID
jgi:hypothetical protein